MKSRKYFVSLMALALFLTGSLFAFAQTGGTVRGKVELKKADGSVVPVEGATIDVYRTDAKGKLPSAKTGKKGAFSFAGVPSGQVFAIVVSAPNVKAEVFTEIKSGQENVNITVSEGDGKTYTEEQVRQALAAAGNQPKLSAEEAKKIEEINNRNKQAEQSNAVIKRAVEEGNKAYEAKNYDLALAKYDEGINASPDFVGSAPVLLRNKAIVLRNRAIEKYKQSTTPESKKAAMDSISKDLLDSATSLERAVQILKTATPTDTGTAQTKILVNSDLVETYRLLIQATANSTKGKEALTALENYTATETDAAKKLKTQMGLADALRLAGDSENAIPAYRKILETAPDNPDALAGLGLSLFSVGAGSNDKAQMQEGLNLMQRFTEVAPENHPLKASVKESVDYLKNQEKLTPQKTTKAASTKKRG